jgi:uncharacterized membrane protein YhaH (DUF805 family)
MDSIVSNTFLFGFRGRINRFKYWYAAFAGMTVCLIFMAILAFGIAAIFGANVQQVAIHPTDVFGTPPASPFRASFKNIPPGSAETLIALSFYAAATPIFIVGMWISLAATIKRLHDRNRSGWWTIVLVLAPALFGKLGDGSDASNTASLLAFAALPLAIWGAVELLFLKGTKGPNRFGPDPLAPATPIDRRPGWDQHSELEYAPRSAGPAAGPHANRGP